MRTAWPILRKGQGSVGAWESTIRRIASISDSVTGIGCRPAPTNPTTPSVVTTRFLVERDPAEDVAREERQVHSLDTISPDPARAVGGQKLLHALVAQYSTHCALVVGPHAHGIPQGCWFRRNDHRSRLFTF